MTKIIIVKNCGECPYIGIEETPPLKCLCAPSENYGKIIDDIFSIPNWCPLEETTNNSELSEILKEIK